MDRRNFIKNTLITTAAIAAGGVLGGAVLSNSSNTQTGKDGKRMKILVITGSPRKHGNSNTLADNFIRGAQENGHEIVRFDSASKNVHPCIACNKCGMNGECVFKDDFEFIRKNIIDADMVVLASPMYYFGLSAQIKAVIDRFYAINGQIHTPKKAALLMTYANSSSKDAQPIINHYEVLLDYLGWSDAGKIIASGVWTEGDVNSTDYVKRAYELGKSI